MMIIRRQNHEKTKIQYLSLKEVEFEKTVSVYTKPPYLNRVLNDCGCGGKRHPTFGSCLQCNGSGISTFYDGVPIGWKNNVIQKTVKEKQKEIFWTKTKKKAFKFEEYSRTKSEFWSKCIHNETENGTFNFFEEEL